MTGAGVNRAARRAAHKPRLTGAHLTQLTQEGQGILSLSLVGPQEAGSLLAGVIAGDVRCITLIRALIDTLQHVESVSPPVLCLTCAAALRTVRQVALVSIVAGEVDNPQIGIGSAICVSCSERHDLVSEVHAVLRKIWPDLRPLTISAGPEAVQ